MTAVAFDSVSVTLDGARVVEGVSADVAEGEWVTLIGPNGAGKTTLLRALAGLVPHEGGIEVGGEDASALGRHERARRLALVPQTPLMPPYMTVAEYVLLGRTPHISYFGGESRRDLQTADRALARLDLVEFAHRRLGTLSGGERQRALLARAVAQDAPVLLLDEPTSSLDVGRGQQALELVDSLRRDAGLTVLCAMHDLTLAAQYADRLLLLDRGRLVAAGAPRDVLTDARIAERYGALVRVIDDGEAVAVIPARPPRRPGP